MILSNQLTRFRRLSASSPEQDGINASQGMLISDACAAEDMHYYGFKLGLRVSRAGIITQYSILQSRSHDIQSLETLLEGFEGIAPAEKASLMSSDSLFFWSGAAFLAVTPPRKNMNSTPPEPFLKFCRRARKRIEKFWRSLSVFSLIYPATALRLIWMGWLLYKELHIG